MPDYLRVIKKGLMRMEGVFSPHPGTGKALTVWKYNERGDHENVYIEA